jgi:hypothetical protein
LFTCFQHWLGSGFDDQICPLCRVKIVGVQMNVVLDSVGLSRCGECTLTPVERDERVYVAD